MKIYQVLDGIWATCGETQRDVSVDDDDEAKEAYIRYMEEGDEPMSRGVDEFTASHSATDER